VDAKPLLVEVAQHMHAVKLEGVLIGNAAAALRGAPVTTVDFDFLFRRTARNLAKLKALATKLGAVVMRPYYPASDLYRIVRDDDGLQIDFMSTIHGLRSFEGLRDRASDIELDGVTVRVAALEDVIRSKRAARRSRDLAVLDILEKTLEQTPRQTGAAGRPRPRK
jgi:predicted nucleotidyltransferase